MIAALMTYSLLVGVLVAVGTWLLDAAARRASIPRRWAWSGALVMLASLTFAAPWRASAPVAIDPSLMRVVESTTFAAPISEQPFVRLDAAAAWCAETVRQLLMSVQQTVPEGSNQLLVVLWLLASATGVLVIWSSLRRLHQQRLRWPHAIVAGHRLRIADEEGPAVYGVLHTELVVPRRFLNCSADEQALVLTHETEHQRAHDPLLLAFGAAMVALLPWHPFAWWMAARLRLAVELDCDARVLGRGAPTRRYAETLLALASTMPRRSKLLPALSLLDSRSHLEQRLLAMTSRTNRRTPLRVLAVVGLVAAVVFAACNTDVPTAAEIRDADVSTFTKTVGVSDATGTVKYFVDTKEVTPEQAKAIAPEVIATMNVRGASTANEKEVHIITRDMAGKESAVGATRKLEWTAADAPNDSLHIAFVTADTLAVTGTIVLRGAVESNSAGKPLIVIDGVLQASSEINNIGVDKNRIESIEVIKGAAASTAYGSRGANGVIVITTKKK